MIAGDGMMTSWVRNEVAAHDLHDKFELLGQLPAQDKPGLFASADALLVLLRADPVFVLAIPGKVQSYLASGKPSLATVDGEGARVVEESGAGLALRQADFPTPEPEQMGNRARDYAAREFGRELLIERLEN